MIATILASVAILSESTAAASHLRNNASPPDDPLDQTAAAPWMAPGVPSKFRSTLEMANQSLYRHAPRSQMRRPLQTHAPDGRFLIRTGVIAYTDPKQGYAIIGNSGDNTFLVRPVLVPALTLVMWRLQRTPAEERRERALVTAGDAEAVPLAKAG